MTEKLRVQFCDDGDTTINGSPTAKRDAWAVRVWYNDFLVLAVTKSGYGSTGRWKYDCSDAGHTYSTELMEQEFLTWEAAFEAFSVNLNNIED